jgi:hypothetical protein
LPADEICLTDKRRHGPEMTAMKLGVLHLRWGQSRLGGGSAAAEFDPKAFLHWQPRDLIIAPMNLHGDRRGRGAFSGLVLLQANADGLPQLGRLGTTAAYGSVNRSLVIGDTVYVLSDQALQAHSLETHREVDKLLL